MKISPRQGNFEQMRVVNSTTSGGIIRISLIFYNMEYVVCSHQNRLTEAILVSTHNIPFSYKHEESHLIIPNLQPRDFSYGLKNEFETAVVNEPSVFEPLKFYCKNIIQIGQALKKYCHVNYKL